MSELPLIVFGVVAGLAMLGVARRTRLMATDGLRPDPAALVYRWADSARAMAGHRVGGSRSLRSYRQRRRRPAKAGEGPPEPVWVKVAGPQAWRERKDVGCQQCAPSWELGMKTCVRCGRRLADVFTAGGQRANRR